MVGLGYDCGASVECAVVWKWEKALGGRELYLYLGAEAS